ncbi:hypothetical protein O181_082981 [Austropuccinia psidii MF-1]|uniref:Uncharacterized protein n=1 Tax=Austropuccinia psidii MF-1 TaxID=1389203 RepID=A0A9Q3IHH1_9BASI|nr:hypothetical protein [Austropuccinia psidii MF-1]
MAKTTLGPKLAKNLKLTINQSMASGNHRRPPDQLKARIPSSSGEDFPFLNSLRTQGPGVVHIWYNIPLCTIFPQQSSGDTFRTQLFWKFPGGYQKTLQGPQPPGPADVGLSFSHQDHSKGNSQSLSIFSIIVKASSIQHSWTSQLVHTGSNQASCMALAQSGQFIFHCGNPVTQINSQDGQNFIGPIQTI